MSTLALMPIEEYLTYSGKPYLEYRDGITLAKPMPTWFHSLIQLALAGMLQRQGVFAGIEVRLPISTQKYLIPDVIAARTIEDPYPTKPVLLCCEIFSPDDHIGATLAKCEEYHSWGVPYCWVVDPMKRSAWEYHSGGEPNRVIDTLHAGELVVQLEELFAVLPQ